MIKYWLLGVLSLLVLGCSGLRAEIDPFTKARFSAGFYLKSFPGLSKADVEVGIKYWGEQLGRNNNIPVEIRLYEDITEMQQDFIRGDINFISGSAWIIATSFDRELLADGFKISRSGTTEDSLILLARNDENLHDPKKLADKQLGILDGDQVAEVLLDIYTLTHFAKPYRKVFPKSLKRSKSMQLVVNLFFEKIDLIVIYQRLYEIAIELNPQIKQQTRIIESVPNLTWGLGFFHKNVPVEFRELIIYAAKKIHHNARGRQLIQLFHGDKFERSTVRDLDSIDSLKQRYDNLLKKTLVSH